MILETVDISDISQDPANVRKHSERNLESIAASLRAFGQQKPIVVDKRGVILAGNGTYEAAKRIGWDKIKITRTDLSGTLATAYAIADNRTAELAEWDDTALAEQLRSLQSEEFDLANVGYTDDEVQQLIDGIGDDLLGASQVTEDEIPEPPVEPITKPGDLWLLGDHRLLCGDSTKAEDVGRLMAGAKADMMVTDPPYGVDYDPTWRDGVGAFVEKTKMRGVVSNDGIVDWTAAYSLFAGAVAYVWHAGKFCGQVADNLAACDFDIRSQIIWKKHHFAMSRGDYHWHHEPCWYAVRKGMSSNWGGDRTQSTIWEITSLNPSGRGKADAADEKTVHGTQKPVECMARPIRNHEAELIYDPFLGSGTTLIAAEQLGRKCYGMEISPQYCDVIVKRWETFTGMVATRA